MGTLKVMGEINGECYAGNRVLGRVGLISDNNRKAHIGNTDAIDSYFPVIRKALSVDQRGHSLRLHSIFRFRQNNYPQITQITQIFFR